MSTEQMSTEFDVMFNNIMSNQAPGYTLYEKSLVLTQAQESIMIALYNGAVGTSFEETEEFTTYLSPLVRQAVITDVESDDNLPHIVSGSYIFKLPDDMMFRTYESCTLASETDLACQGGSIDDVLVEPVTQDKFMKAYKNPFRGANTRRVLRLAYDISDNLSLNADTLTYSAEGGMRDVTVSADGRWEVVDGGDTANNPKKYVELVSKYPIAEYKVRYVRYPNPIILGDLPEGVTINGFSTKMPCELNEQIHRRIVMEAVNIAKSIWS